MTLFEDQGAGVRASAPTDGVSWMGEGDAVPNDRYFCPVFAEREVALLWPRTWLMVCRVVDLGGSGDYVEFTIADQSVLVVRTGDGEIAAMHNACRHRGARLAVGSGTLSEGCLVCPFHGWAYELDGRLRRVTARAQYAELDDAALGLAPVLVDTWGGWVFVNLDPHAVALREYLRPLATILERFEPERMHARWFKQTTLPVNWKTVLEAFIESYHVPSVHAQIPFDSQSLVHFAHEHGHSHYRLDDRARAAPRSAHHGSKLELPDADFLHGYITGLAEGLGGITLDEDKIISRSLLHAPIPAGSSVAAEYRRRMYEHYAGCGVDLPELTAIQALEQGAVYFLFPNMVVLSGIANLLVYRARPNGTDPESSIWDVWSLKRFPTGEEPDTVRDPTWIDRRNVAEWGLVMHQDFANCERVQRGLHSRGFTHSTLNAEQEKGILNAQREIDRYLRD